MGEITICVFTDVHTREGAEHEYETMLAEKDS